MPQHKNLVIFLSIILCFSISCLVSAADDIEKRLLKAMENQDLNELEAMENVLKPQVASNETRRFLLGKAMFFKEKVIAEKAGAAPANTPHLYTQGNYTYKAVLLIHGFTASPWEMNDLGEFFKEQGINAYALRLAGHGTRPEDLLDISWRDWYKSVEAGLKVTKLLGREVYVVGLSTGGALAVKLAAEHPKEIKGVVTLAPALYLQDWKSSLSGIAQFFAKYNVRPLEDKFKPYYYENRSLSAIWELVKLTRHAREEAKKITIPILIVQSKADKIVKPKGAQYLYNRVKSKDKQLIWLKEAPHVLITFENPEQGHVFQLISDFLKKSS